MKQLLLIALAFTFATANAQTATTAASQEKKDTEKSKLETFSLKTGSLIKKEYTDVGEVKKVETEVIKITDLLAKTTVSGVKLSTKVYKTYGSETKSCFLDADEIDGFIKSGKLLLQELATGSTTAYTEYQFTSRDGFQAGAYLNEKKEWRYFLKLEKYDSDSYAWLAKEDFEKIVSMVEEAKAKL